MTPLEIFTATCGGIFVATSIAMTFRKSAPRDSGAYIEEHFTQGMAEAPKFSLLLLYLYLLWFRGFVPHAVEHNWFDYYCLLLGALLVPALCVSLYHLLAWLKLEAGGMEFDYGPGGPSGGLFRISHRDADGPALIDLTPRQTRETEEVLNRKKRRKAFRKSSLALTAAAVTTYLSWGYAEWIGWIAGIILLGPAFAWWLQPATELAAYAAGAHYIPGAAVREPRPVKRDAPIEEQKAHGAARLATEQETVAAAEGIIKRSSVHDQKF